MVNQNTKLEADLFEELNDTDLMAVVGGTLTAKAISQVFPVVDFADKSTNFDELGKGVSQTGDGLGSGIGSIGGFITTD